MDDEVRVPAAGGSRPSASIRRPVLAASGPRNRLEETRRRRKSSTEASGLTGGRVDHRQVEGRSGPRRRRRPPRSARAGPHMSMSDVVEDRYRGEAGGPSTCVVWSGAPHHPVPPCPAALQRPRPVAPSGSSAAGSPITANMTRIPGLLTDVHPAPRPGAWACQHGILPVPAQGRDGGQVGSRPAPPGPTGGRRGLPGAGTTLGGGPGRAPVSPRPAGPACRGPQPGRRPGAARLSRMAASSVGGPSSCRAATAPGATRIPLPGLPRRRWTGRAAVPPAASAGHRRAGRARCVPPRHSRRAARASGARSVSSAVLAGSSPTLARSPGVDGEYHVQVQPGEARAHHPGVPGNEARARTTLEDRRPPTPRTPPGGRVPPVQRPSRAPRRCRCRARTASASRVLCVGGLQACPGWGR